ncbi:hypothetical protein XM53_17250 [Roseovarius atlanticus]|uniref:Uncharacterized protein n=1 Tax=Roseovarius atlanticus TaxID=1641875 RepID=A0A0T5NQT3_9RHOB|nr:hypothetical protein XM53_17250 [Roseovarius atlanticus]
MFGQADSSGLGDLVRNRLAVKRGKLIFALAPGKGIHLLAETGGLEHFGKKRCLELLGRLARCV